jgi:Arc/MetJ-type ribon-helix-helix transcriptional regulator
VDKLVELRVTVDDKLNKLLDEIVASGIYQSKAELMRSATVYLLVQMDLIKDHIQNDSLPKKKPTT